jgi:hypothetical protein
MEIIIHDHWVRKVSGSSLKGYVTTTLDRLKEVFGNPLEGGDKVTAEWIIEDEDGNLATIYDWKLSDTPTGVYQWHIGGHNSRALDIIRTMLPEARVSTDYIYGNTI